MKILVYDPSKKDCSDLFSHYSHLFSKEMEIEYASTTIAACELMERNPSSFSALFVGPAPHLGMTQVTLRALMFSAMNSHVTVIVYSDLDKASLASSMSIEEGKNYDYYVRKSEDNQKIKQTLDSLISAA